ncbi:hypothetical protein GF359_07590 [candidate division WOR-3 bacterium]|uniref:DUF5362 domain-containing protein n=1 Tax=candidate division WOR-3 bacterium TaxID=2052148 RepID=A0A9D5K9Y1_UNCW3|nr:hypothetical protein [candidate division WOR-3 bacterium]MBD3365063.1 hypothetical protein [candidate division WOR-3 bacterium]
MDQTQAVVPDAGVMERIRAEISSTKGWLKFLGVIILIYGILTALALVGILFIFLGIILMNAGKGGQSYVERGDLNGLVEYHSKLKTYFTITGVLAIIGLAGMGLSLIIVLIAAIAGGF